jgi:hypothetical protein
VRGLQTGELKGAKVGNIFYGSEGYGVSTDYSSGTLFDAKGEKIAHFDGGSSHVENFLTAVRSRKHTDLTADIEEGHLSAALCHLGNISYRLGANQPIGGKKPSALAKNKEAQESFARFEAHLEENKVDLKKTPFRMGRELTVDPKTETFINGSREANSLLARQYRKGFAVPGTA